jgi:hypothetical protein
MIVRTGRVHQSHGDGRHAQRFSISSTGEDYILHPGAAQGFSGLLTQHPANGVAQVGFSTAVGSNDGGNPRAGESHFGFFYEGLEALNLDPLQFEQNECTFLLSSRGDG